VKKGIAKLVATFFYVGYFPYAPGTMGTLAAVPLYFLVSGFPYYFYIPFTVLFIVLSIWAAGVAEGIFGEKDPGLIVADEVSGYLVTMIFIPFSLTNLVIGFFLFRLFDIVKPPPSRQAEKLSGGLGVVMDDVMSGVYANIVLQIIVRILL
jgi:phosphatidylglycerophosphatase A